MWGRISIPGLLFYFLSSEYIEKVPVIGVQTKFDKALSFGFGLEGGVEGRLLCRLNLSHIYVLVQIYQSSDFGFLGQGPAITKRKWGFLFVNVPWVYPPKSPGSWRWRLLVGQSPSIPGYLA